MHSQLVPVVNAVQAMTDVDGRATILSIDGIGAFDLVSRGDMLEGLRTVEGGGDALPFVMQFYGSPSTYLWEDEEGVNHEIPQGEGGEQGDPLMPALFALGLHQALLAVQANLLPSERLLAFVDDIYVVCSPERVSDVYTSLQHELWRHSRIEVHQGKTQLWNRDGVMPSGCEAMTIAARAQDENAIVWRGDHELPPVQQVVKFLSTPLGHVAFVEDQLAKLSVSHSVLFERIQAVTDLQVAWLLLVFCAASRANNYLRVVHPRLVHTFAERHDAAVWRCLQGLLGIAGDGLTLDLAQLPFHWGGLGLRSAARSSCIGRVGRTACP